MTEVVDLTRDDINRIIRIEVNGDPHTLPRTRTSWKSKQKHYNPAKSQLTSFADLVKAAIPEWSEGCIYSIGIPVTMTLIFYLKRCNTDFINNKRGLGRLKSMLPYTKPKVPDIDNLAKFVLDALTNVVYQDDRQVVKLVIYKLLDNDGECQGRTIIIFSVFDPCRDLPSIAVDELV